MTDFEDDTPTEADLAACYDGNYLNATAPGDRKTRTKIARVHKKALPQQGGGTKTKFILSFTTVDKEMVLNATNKNALVDELGRNPADWIGAEVGLFTEPTNMGGKPTRSLRLRVLKNPSSTHQRQSHHPSRTSCLGQTKLVLCQLKAIPVPTSTTPPIEQSLAGCPIYGAARYSHRTCRV
jgi:hypothetical protein